MKLSKRWITVSNPGWFGEAKNDRLAGYDKAYGAGNWRIRHRLGPRLLDLPEALRLYELCYELHFLSPNTRYLWTDLFKQASEVWTELESDVESGLDYSIQKAKAPHYEDVSIRIIMKLYGHTFDGNKLIRIRADSNDVTGVALSSIHIPFLWPEFIEPTKEVEWWNRHKGSLEHFWHANKELQIIDPLYRTTP
ncbi:MAG: hypothetical protein WC310_00305 [Patescibacteria group bacterium]|jgi:hypothetical protein